MVYTLQHGVQKTWTDYIGKSLRYGGAVLGFALVALVVGNVWYALRYNPVTQPSTGSSHQVAKTPITLANANIDQGVGAGDVQPSVPGVAMLMNGSHWTYSGQSAGQLIGSASSDAGTTNLPVDTPPADTTTIPDPSTGTTPADPGTGTTDPGAGDPGAGTTDPIPPVVTVPPVTVTPPVVPITVTTPPLDLSL